MTSRERQIIKEVKPLVDRGVRGLVMRVYQNLTTRRRRMKKCKRQSCDGKVIPHTSYNRNEYCSVLCWQLHRKESRMKKLLSVAASVALCGIVLGAPSTNTGQITYGWTYNLVSNPAVTNFVVYWGPSSGTYTNNANVGTNLTFTLTGLTRGSTYWAAATAQDTNGLESDYSTEASKTIPNKPPKPTTFTAQ